MIFNAGMGHFNRVAVMTGPGTVIGDGRKVPTVEEIHKHWDAINNMSGAAEFPNAVAAYGPMLDAFGPKKEAGAGGEGLTVRGIFERIPEAFRAEKAAGVDVVFQFDISGGGGGTWYVTVKEKACSVTAGKHEKPTTAIKMGDEDFIKLIKGELNAMKAYTSGRVKIEGDLIKSQLIEKLFKF
jgi:putative sterol carrier protein